MLALAFVRYLDDHPDALVIFDNVEDPRSLRTPLYGIIPAQLHCRLLFTTRRRDNAGTFTVVEVGALPEAQSLQPPLAHEERHSLRGGGDEGELAAAEVICGMLGHGRLALALASAYLGQILISLADYRDRLAGRSARSIG